jgi:hypothetical protein
VDVNVEKAKCNQSTSVRIVFEKIESLTKCELSMSVEDSGIEIQIEAHNYMSMSVTRMQDKVIRIKAGSKYFETVMKCMG